MKKHESTINQTLESNVTVAEEAYVAEQSQQSQNYETLWDSGIKFSSEDCRKESEQLDRLNEALSKYGSIKDYNSIITVYEDVFSEQINWNALTHKLKLSEMYIKAGRLDDSWKLLNALINEYPDELARIRGCQFKQLKREKKYHEALRMWYMHKFDKISLTRSDYETYGNEIYSQEEIYEFIAYDIEEFTKTASIIAQKAKIPIANIKDLETVFVSCFANRMSEGKAVQKFNEWFKSLGF